ncbi:hypothetical protein M9H77_25664 [Catharanthus roseus]|uniref:Uncharacterized protein n=1 Tax=Catharanthus roseus TaxID=4058 RepID=A0ACC0A8F4_CATRO|nr:hypothetical protein M9H77_25664 [Catharanthus roseus]
MENQDQSSKSKVVKVDSKDSWEFHVNQIVVHFTAAWCMPSVAMNPFFEELATNFPDVSFLTVDVDEVKEVASKYEVKAMPTFLLMKNGSPIDKLVGANPDEIKKRIENLLLQSNPVIVE